MSEESGRAGRGERGDRGDRIEISGLRVLGVHGVLPEERERAQPFSVDLVAWADMTAAQQSDQLSDTVDYGALAQLAAEVVAQRSFRLLETLAGRLAGALLVADPRLLAVAVTVRKLRPPLALDVASAGVRVYRER
jgi:dihydroneopterin aldolase